ncbi:glycosyltransferase [Polaribacter sp. AHE13PA]|uniref:GumK N-terminal domain-containing glycosyltransferase n=1 Tax=Polaribacter sp. AHE13PA TaxID=2745562 RepID=UPI001C4F6E1B|nr:glycosyltransferase [Polaribacter sp. AHE13PA]QXP66972.1 glycosyltransferase [Polaribacter sp. AHE13PA]
MKSKIVFLTFHNWESKRQGGFHKFAEEFANKGWRVFFFSVPRPYYSYFKNDERLNKTVLKNLSKGLEYSIGKGSLLNLTLPTFALPGGLRKFFSNKVNKFLQKTSLQNTNKFLQDKFKGVTHFVFESNEALLYYKKIRKLFPDAKIIYRPSDPVCANKNASLHIVEAEKEILFNADLVFLVNKENFDTVTGFYKEYTKSKNCAILNNGVDMDAYTQTYSIPNALQKENTVLYVGARDIDWDMIVEAANLDKHLNFVIVCPEIPNENFINYTNLKNTNLFYIDGIKPTDVPKYITNADVVIVPNPKDRYKTKNWGITAKYLQAMAAKKPIVAYHDGEYLKDYEIEPVYNTTDFLLKINTALKKPVVNYNYNLAERDWTVLTEKFYNSIINL